MNINQIASIVNKNFLRGNRFKVQGFGYADDYCCRVVWPNITYSTFNWKNAGPNIKVPYEPTFDEVEFEFYCDHDGIVPSELRRLNRSLMTDDFQFRFFNEYVRDITIKEYNTSNIPVHLKRLVNAYIISVNPVVLSFENQNQVEKMSVLVAYEYSEDIG